jgi:hypothetical protein
LLPRSPTKCRPPRTSSSSASQTWKRVAPIAVCRRSRAPVTQSILHTKRQCTRMRLGQITPYMEDFHCRATASQCYLAQRGVGGTGPRRAPRQLHPTFTPDLHHEQHPSWCIAPGRIQIKNLTFLSNLPIGHPLLLNCTSPSLCCQYQTGVSTPTCTGSCRSSRFYLECSR